MEHMCICTWGYTNAAPSVVSVITSIAQGHGERRRPCSEESTTVKGNLGSIVVTNLNYYYERHNMTARFSAWPIDPFFHGKVSARETTGLWHTHNTLHLLIYLYTMSCCCCRSLVSCMTPRPLPTSPTAGSFPLRWVGGSPTVSPPSDSDDILQLLYVVFGKMRLVGCDDPSIWLPNPPSPSHAHYRTRTPSYVYLAFSLQPCKIISRQCWWARPQGYLADNAVLRTRQTRMVFTIGTLFEAALLLINAIAILNEERFLAKGWQDTHNRTEGDVVFYLMHT